MLRRLTCIALACCATARVAQHGQPHALMPEALQQQQREKVAVDTQGVTMEEDGEADEAVTHARPVCAVGDMHGDPHHAFEALRLCGAVNESASWVGGTMTVVQVGDVFDRGSHSVALQTLLWKVRDEAAAAGGELKLLLGNHELLNMQGRLHYVHGFSRSGYHTGELAEYGGASAWQRALSPRDGELGRKINEHDGLAIRGEGACRSLFLHAGLRSHHAVQFGSVDAINLELRRQIESGKGELLDSQNGPLWFRGYARPGASEERACIELQQTLEAVGDEPARMVVGHNIVPWVSSRCGGNLQMIDVGMSGAYGGRPAAWRCELDDAGEAVVRALYREGEEEPPPLCARCAEKLKLHHALGDVLSADDVQDCLQYCPQTYA
tara:strand:+ start:177 stop:1322 length:1146 start_codon:yes stop_codon:yes gene_type:complete